MLNPSDLQLNPSIIDPPGNDEKFEIFCCALVRKIWQDPNAQRVGRNGQNQHGVDIISRPNSGTAYWGLQSKNNSQTKGKLDEKAIREEVEKAKTFDQPLCNYYIATTLPRDNGLQAIARKITSEHVSKGLFSVYIWTWEDIREYLLENIDLLYTYWPHLRPGSETTNDARIDDIKRTTEKILENQTIEQTDNASSFNKEILNTSIDKNNEQSNQHKNDIANAKLDSIREQIDSFNPISAIKALEQVKKEYWTASDNLLKFRIITNFAAAESMIGKEDEAAKHFIEALQYNPADEKALCNAATGYLLQENKKEAIRLVKKILKLNPASDRGYSLQIYASEKDTPIETIIENIPKANLDSTTVSCAVGFISRLRGDNQSSAQWFRIAMKKDPKDIEISASLAETMLQLMIDNQTLLYGKQLTKQIRKELEEIDSIFKNNWNSISDKEIQKFRVSWLANRSMANQLLGRNEIALHIVNEALEIKPHDKDLIKHKAILLFEAGRKEEAISLVKTVKNYNSKPEIGIPIAAMFRDIGQNNEAIDLLRELKNKTKETTAIEEINRMLIDLYAASNQIKEAQKLSDLLIKKDPENISYYIDKARLCLEIKDNASAESFLATAKNKINKHSSKRKIIELGNAFYSQEKFNEASSIFEKVADKRSDSELTRKLLNSYYRAGKLGEALAITKELRASQGPIRYVTELESSIFEEIGDWEKSKEVCREYLENNKNDQEIQIRYAVALLRSGSKNDLEELNSILEKTFNTSDLSFNFWIQLISLYENRGYPDKALENMYEVRRKFFDKPEAHLQYVGLFFRTEKVNEPVLDHKEVEIESAIMLGDEPATQQWYILEPREDSDLNRNEINKDHPLFNQLLGKKIGDIITITNNGPAPEILVVKDIKHKYVYALHDSLNNFSTRFPTTEGLWGVKTQASEDIRDGQMPQGLEIILNQVAKQDDHIHQVEQFYKEGKLTLGAMAKLIGKDVLTTWGGIISIKGPGLKSSNGTFEERKESLLTLRSVSKPKLIIDPISIMTIHGIGIADSIVKHFGKLGIASSTVDLIRENIAEKHGLGFGGYMTIAKEGDKFIRDEITQEQVQKNIEYLESTLGWIKNNCDISPCLAALEISRDKKIESEELLGKESYDTILLAAQPNHILYSDDERLRSLAKDSYGCAGIWTQLLMMEMLHKDTISEEEYAKAVLKLINSNYHHTSISKEVLSEAATQSSWEIKEPLISILDRLKEGQSDLRSSVTVSSEFIEMLWNINNLKATQANKLQIINYTIDILIENRSLTEVIQQLKNEFERLFAKNPTDKERIKSIIRIWGKNRGVEFDI